MSSMNNELDKTDPSEQGDATDPLTPLNKPPVKKRPATNCLDNLSNDVKSRLHALIASGQGGINCRSTMMAQYRGTPMADLVSVASATYSRYIALHRFEIKNAADAQREAQKAIIVGFNETAQDLKALADATTKPGNGLENKKAALISLYENAEKRRKLLEAKQNENFLDRQIEVLIGQYMREQRALVESLVTLQEELAKDSDKELAISYKAYTETLLTQMIYAYKAVNGETNLIEYKVELEKRYDIALTNWLKKMQGGN